jgi:hypothetical protein
MYICYNSFFDENSFRNDFEEDYSVPVCPYFEAMTRQMPPPPPGVPFGGSGFNPQAPSGSQGYNAPSGPPPTFTPTKAQAQFQTKAISGAAIRPCTFRYVYIWLENGRSFWAWLVRIDRRSASGWRWNGRRWMYFGIDLRRIDSFICY